MNKKIQAYVARKERKKKIRKIILGSISFICIVTLIFVKAPFLNISKINIKGNKILKDNKVLQSKSVLGSNIFLLDKNKLQEDILKNPYIKSVDIKRILPNELEVVIEERKMIYRVKDNNKSYILNKDLIIMAISNNPDGMSLIDLKGVKIQNRTVGQAITNNKAVIALADKIGSEFISEKNKNTFTSLDLSSINNIVLHKDKIKIIMGNDKDLQKKYEKAYKIINDKDIDLKDGYIDVSFIDQPVIKGNIKKDLLEGDKE